MMGACISQCGRHKNLSLKAGITSSTIITTSGHVVAIVPEYRHNDIQKLMSVDIVMDFASK